MNTDARDVQQAWERLIKENRFYRYRTERMDADLALVRAERDRLYESIQWVLSEGEDFEGSYYWRTELRDRMQGAPHD